MYADPIHHLQQLLLQRAVSHPSEQSVSRLCTPLVNFRSSEPFDLSFGCGYRNFQMLLSCLVNASSPDDVPLFLGQKLQAYFGLKQMPDIQEIQDVIEMAWADGFDKVLPIVHASL